MIIRINGVEIVEGTAKEEYNQLVEGLSDLGINTLGETINWVTDLSLQEYGEFVKIVDSYGFETVMNFLSFGLF